MFSLVILGSFFSLGGLFLSRASSSKEAGFDRYVQKYSRKNGLDPALTRAVIRAESSGRTRAVSPAGALGLMQLMPATAREVAGEIGLSHPREEDLFDPELNIRLGTRYLGRLRREFRDDPHLYLAAYNAGPGAVRRWVRSMPGHSSELVIRKAAYPQTRAYVRKILGQWKEDRP